MMSMLSYLIFYYSHFTTFYLEMFLAVFVFSLPLARRRSPLFQIACGLPAFILVPLLNLLVFLLIPAQSVVNISVSAVWCVSILLFQTLSVRLSFHTTTREAVYCAVCGYLMEHTAYCVNIILSYLLFQGTAPEGKKFTYYISFFGVYLLFYLVFARKMVVNGRLSTTAVNSLNITIAALLVVIVLSLLASAYGFQLLHAVYASALCLLLMTSQLNEQKRIALQERINIQQQIMLRNQTQYELSRDNIKLINQKCHDLKHQISALRHIQDPAVHAKAVQSIEQSVMIYESIADTGNPALNTLLTEKSLLCNTHHIDLHIIADGSLLNWLDEIQLYTLFGNALDNAIEAVQKLPQEERYIRLQVRQRANLVIIVMENPYQGGLKMHNGLPETTKEADGYHGFGLRSMKKIVEQNDGIFLLKQEDGVFRLQISFPTRQVTAEN